jgi:hypothetical protein
MNKIIAVCLSLLLAATVVGRAQTAGGGGGRGSVSVPIEARTVKGMPYSAEISNESVQTLGDGNRIIRHSSGRIYRDSEGRVRREEDTAAGPATVTISDPVAGKSFTLSPANKTARETASAPLLEAMQLLNFQIASQTNAGWVIRPGAVSVAAQGGGRGGARGGNGAVEEKLPDRFIEGVTATGVRRTTTIEKGAIGNELPITIVSEEWTSPDLQVLVLTDLNDPRTGHSTYKLMRITRGEPDPALFQVPPDYTLAPSGARGRVGRGGGQ